MTSDNSRPTYKKVLFSKLNSPFWRTMLISSLILGVVGFHTEALALSSTSSSSSKPLEAFEAVKNSNPRNRILSNTVSRSLVLDDSVILPMHSPLYDGTSTVDLAPETIQDDQIYLYTVRDGDTIADVSKMYGVSTNTILWANDLSSKSSLKAGQVLVILPINGVKYTVKSGDTVESIAKKFKSHTENITTYNNLEGGKLAVGTEIIIPDGEMTSTASTVVSNTTSYPSNGLILGYFIRPVVGGIKTQNVHGHNGIDIGAPIGTPIRATADGKVVLARSGGWGGGYGSYVIIQHPNGMQTLYGHMSRVDVSVGDSVSQGQTIGAVGNTGDSHGAHLHIEVHMKGGANPPNRFY
jgi:murein DD-endopeptidase MepM/ murein hydrolase activator NlpD